MGLHISKIRMYFRTPTALLKDVDKVLEQKSSAKRHPSTVRAYEELIQNNPQLQNIVKEKNEGLHKMLETVKVESAGLAPTENLKSGKKTRQIKIRPDGKLTVNQVDELFINYKVSPDVWTPQKVAADYKLDNQVAANLLTFYSSFRIYKIPKKSEENPKLFFQKDEDSEMGKL